MTQPHGVMVGELRLRLPEPEAFVRSEVHFFTALKILSEFVDSASKDEIFGVHSVREIIPFTLCIKGISNETIRKDLEKLKTAVIDIPEVIIPEFTETIVRPDGTVLALFKVTEEIPGISLKQFIEKATFQERCNIIDKYLELVQKLLNNKVYLLRSDLENIYTDGKQLWICANGTLHKQDTHLLIPHKELAPHLLQQENREEASECDVVWGIAHFIMKIFSQAPPFLTMDIATEKKAISPIPYLIPKTPKEERSARKKCIELLAVVCFLSKRIRLTVKEVHECWAALIEISDETLEDILPKEMDEEIQNLSLETIIPLFRLVRFTLIDAIAHPEAIYRRPKGGSSVGSDGSSSERSYIVHVDPSSGEEYAGDSTASEDFL